MVIDVGNEDGEPSSNSRRNSLHFICRLHHWERYAFNYSNSRAECALIYGYLSRIRFGLFGFMAYQPLLVI